MSKVKIKTGREEGRREASVQVQHSTVPYPFLQVFQTPLDCWLSVGYQSGAIHSRTHWKTRAPSHGNTKVQEKGNQEVHERIFQTHVCLAFLCRQRTQSKHSGCSLPRQARTAVCSWDVFYFPFVSWILITLIKEMKKSTYKEESCVWAHGISPRH